jgi:2-isopropylmalate synthase
LFGIFNKKKLSLLPRFLARALVEDIKPIVALNQAFERDVWADFFINVSPIRRKVENWDINTQLERIQAAGKYLSSHNTKFGVSFEDTSRTSPEELTLVIEAAIEAGAQRLAICDTVGDCTPEGAMKLTQFFLKFIKKYEVKVIWHGHNDKGLGMANAIAAAQAGAHIISGTFLGIGERAGNTPLEQVIMFLFQAGSQQFNLKRIQAYCEKLAEYAHTPIPSTAPLVGGQAFATSAGTHSAAILKARQLGIDFEDAIFSSVPASKLGRIQEIVIGPTSGMANARYLLEQIGITVSEELTHQLLAYAKSKDRWLSSDDIRHYLNATSNGDTL